jgi:small GTP-binding protein
MALTNQPVGGAMLERSFKVVLLGAYAVGKTSLLNRHLAGQFQSEYIPTIRTTISEKAYRVLDCSFKLFYWDPGVEELNGNEAFFGNTDGALIVYDICRPATLSAAERYYDALVRRVDVKPAVWLVGNKLDLSHLRVVDRAFAEKMASELGANYIEVSAKTAENVEALFNSLLKVLIRRRLMEVKSKLKV